LARVQLVAGRGDDGFDSVALLVAGFEPASHRSARSRGGNLRLAATGLHLGGGGGGRAWRLGFADLELGDVFGGSPGNLGEYPVACVDAECGIGPLDYDG
jgi:hypothetical protein